MGIFILIGAIILTTNRKATYEVLAKLLTKIKMNNTNNNDNSNDDTSQKYTIIEEAILPIAMGAILFIFSLLTLIFITESVIDEANSDAKKYLNDDNRLWINIKNI